MAGHSRGKYTFAISEQNTSYDRAQEYEENSIRNGELVRNYSITQFALGYDISDNLGVQINLPLIARNYDSIKNYRADEESDMGLGDLSLLATYSVLNEQEAEWSALAGITVGVKFPTGDTGDLRDASELDTTQTAEQKFIKHHPIGGSAGVGGRVLTFGSGSYDYIFGANSLLRYQKLLFLTQAQYTLRTEGDYNYEFADDFLFSVGPGYFFMLGHDYTLALRLALNGEFKSKDDFDGQIVSGSQVSNLYLGPEILYMLDSKYSGSLGMDFRTTGEDVNATVVPEMRLRFALAYRFSS